MSSFASASLNITSSILFFARANRSSIRRSSEAPFALPENREEVAMTATHATVIEVLITVASSHADFGRRSLDPSPFGILGGSDRRLRCASRPAGSKDCAYLRRYPKYTGTGASLAAVGAGLSRIAGRLVTELSILPHCVAKAQRLATIW